MLNLATEIKTVVNKIFKPERKNENDINTEIQ